MAYEVALPARVSVEKRGLGLLSGADFLFNCLLRQVIWEADRRRSDIWASIRRPRLL